MLGVAAVTSWAAACSGGGAVASSSGSGGASSAHSAHSASSAGAVAVTVGVGGALPQSFTVSGVVTDGTKPVGGAIVMQGGAGKPAMITGPDGAYTLTLTQSIPGTPTVVATKLGYRTEGVEIPSLPGGPVDVALKVVTPPDNTAYQFGDPGTGDAAHDNSTKYCGHCHTTMVAQFQTSAHAEAARSPLVQDLYAGVSEAFTTQAACAAAGGSWRTGIVPGQAPSAMSKCYLGGGVLPDLNPSCGGPAQPACDDPALPAASKPSSFGRCADCHAPGIDGKAGGRNLHEATGIAYENGNHCDVCHHARDVDLTRPPGVAGALILQRPHDAVSSDPGAQLVQVMYGPLLDVPNAFMGGSLQPKFSSSELCGACHDQKQEALLPGTQLDPARWPGGLPTHSAYSEWAASPYNIQGGKQCQDCHMPPDDTGLTNTVDVTKLPLASITFGFARPPDQIRKHIFRDPLNGSPRFIDQAIVMSLATSSGGAKLGVDVQIQNLGAGHALPTGEPMRSLVLLVDAAACGQAMRAVDGMTVNDVGGAAAQGAVGAGVTVAGAVVTWPAGAALAKPGDVVRVVRPTGMYDDYAGIGFFASPALSPKAKGLELQAPVGEATVLSTSANALTLSAALPTQAGDVVYLGDALPAPPADGATSLALAGRAGYTFARVLVDPGGVRGVPHYRAVDMISDNRIAPMAAAMTSHAFAIPAGCSMGSVTATLLYRQIPVGIARLRGWPAKDYVVASATKIVPLP